MAKQIFFEGCTLYETMIESGDDENEVEKVLLIELAKRKLKKSDFPNGLSSININSYSYNNPDTLIDLALYFGITRALERLDQVIYETIRFQTLHQITKYGIILEKLKEMIIKDGLDRILENVLCRGIPPHILLLNYLPGLSNSMSSEEVKKIYNGKYGEYLARCLFYDEYLIENLKRKMMDMYITEKQKETKMPILFEENGRYGFATSRKL